MNLSNGRSYLAIPGPSVMPDAVLRAMHSAAPNIYQGDLVEMTETLVSDLRDVARTRHNLAIYISNGHGAWEAALSNVLPDGAKVLVLATGRFGHGWGEMARGLGIRTKMLSFGQNNPVDTDRVEQILAQDTAHEFSAVLMTHVDTSSSARNDVAAVRQLLDQAGHPALLMVDSIASLGCDRFEMDQWGADVMVAASQKGLMVPPGLGFVFFNDKAAARRSTMKRVSRYWDWEPRANPGFFYQYFGGTAPTHHLLGLRAALDMIHGEGIENVWARHATLARAVWAAVDCWGQAGTMRLNMASPDHRSNAVTTVLLPPKKGSDLRAWLEANTGVTLGIGLGMNTPEDPNSDGVFRIGHMGHVNAHMVLGVLGAIEAGLLALDIPHGGGAIEAAAKVMAGLE